MCLLVTFGRKTICSKADNFDVILPFGYLAEKLPTCLHLEHVPVVDIVSTGVLRKISLLLNSRVLGLFVDGDLGVFFAALATNGC